MRVLFTVNPEKSIFLSMVPLAWALRSAGREVRVASAPGFAGTITGSGLTAVPVGRDRDHSRLLTAAGVDQAILEQPVSGLVPPWNVAEQPENAVWEELLAGYDDAVQQAFKPENFPIIADLVRFARSWRPDLVIWEPFTNAGAIAARACGAAHARMLWSIDVFGLTREVFLKLKAGRTEAEVADPLAQWLGGYGRKYGFPFTEDLVTGQFTIDHFPASIQREAGLHYVRMQHVPHGGPAEVPAWLWAPPGRPRVALTLGITATEVYNGYSFTLQDALDALADLDIEIVATVSEAEQKRLARIPANARVLSFVPLHALAPTCSVVINHAGPGTFLTTALHGVPQINLPWDFDEPELARRAAAQGAALMIPAGQSTGPAIRDAVVRLLSDAAVRERAAALRAEMRGLPTPNELVRSLEELTARYRTQETS